MTDEDVQLIAELRAALNFVRAEHILVSKQLVLARADAEAARSLLLDVQQDCIRLQKTIARVEALGSGPGYVMGDDTLVKLGEVRAALRGKP